MKPNKKYTPYWYAIIAAFGIVELVALLDKNKGDTFTEHIRYWFQLQSPTMWTGRLLAIAILGWISFHFLNPKP